MYEIQQFIQLKKSQNPVPPAIMEKARALWKEMPENIESLASNNSLRDNLFKEGNATMPSKVLTDRKLHNEVLGILGKVTDSNLARMQTELTDLPIRQSTEEEIDEVIRVFFNKSTRPEDSRYTPLYVNLISHLITTIGEHEPAGKAIRKQILEHCRATFLGGADDAKRLEESLVGQPEEEANLARMQFQARQKANVYFLGLMFTRGLVAERVVRAVLDYLLYGKGRTRRTPPDYCIIHFMELMQTCGPQFSPSFYEDPMPRYRTSIEDLRRSHPQVRIQVLLQNFIEAMDNDWVPLHGPGSQPRPRNESNAGGGGGYRGAGSSNNTSGYGVGSPGSPLAPASPPAPPPEPKTRIPPRETVWHALDDFFATSAVDEIITMCSSLPEELLTAYCSTWLGRYITTYRYTQERTRLGELFEELVKKGAMTVPLAQEALMNHVRQAIAEDLFPDQPKYFAHWAAVIKNGKSVFPQSLHTKLLDLLIEHHVSHEVIMKMIVDIQKVLEETTTKTEQKEYQPTERFRVLQALLRYSPPLFAKRPAGGEEEADIISSVAQWDVEVELFNSLCESCDEYEKRSPGPMAYTMEALKKTYSNAYPLISAFFTFVRFDVDGLTQKNRDVLKKLMTVRQPASLLEEVYVQWKSLDCPETYYFAFVKRAQAVSSFKNDVIDKLREKLRTEYHEEELAVRLDKYMK